MLERLRVCNYRSLRDVALEFGQLTVVTGPNGSGKSNLYRALRLVQASAAGRLSRSLLDEGGMPSVLWAGSRAKGPVRMSMTTTWDDLTHELHAGLIQNVSSDLGGKPSRFVLDPEVKEEYVYYGRKRRKATTVAQRAVVAGTFESVDGEKRRTLGLDPAEALLGQIGEPELYPELAMLQRRLRGWRFYHEFDSGPSSPMRRPQAGVRTDALASDGSDLAATAQTLFERGDHRLLFEAVEAAFPGHRVVVLGEPGVFEMGFEAPGLRRPLVAGELSDGQLRFLCLAAALLSTRPPELLVLNEPETSLHPGAVRALAPLIREAARFSQVWVTTHDHGLRDALAGDGTLCHDLEIISGATRVRTSDD